MKMICLKRKPGAQISRFHWSWPGDIWALDTPTSREALTKLVDMGNATFGRGTHWIEEKTTGASISPTPIERRSLDRRNSNWGGLS